MGQVREPKIARSALGESLAIRGDVQVAGVGFPGLARQGRRTDDLQVMSLSSTSGISARQAFEIGQPCDLWF
jgi:hypothetical protein